MNTKLTLRIDVQLIRGAKYYAQREGRSVSELVAAYFARLDALTDEATQTKSAEAAVSDARKSRFYGLLANAQIDGQDADERAYR